MPSCLHEIGVESETAACNCTAAASSLERSRVDASYHGMPAHDCTWVASKHQPRGSCSRRPRATRHRAARRAAQVSIHQVVKPVKATRDFLIFFVCHGICHFIWLTGHMSPVGRSVDPSILQNSECWSLHFYIYKISLAMHGEGLGLRYAEDREGGVDCAPSPPNASATYRRLSPTTSRSFTSSSDGFSTVAPRVRRPPSLTCLTAAASSPAQIVGRLNGSPFDTKNKHGGLDVYSRILSTALRANRSVILRHPFLNT